MTVALQRHIHLSDSLGGTPEYAPTYKWAATNRVLVPNFTVEIDQSLTGDRYDFAIEASGVPVVHKDWYYELFLRADDTYSTEDYMDRLLGLAGKRLYLVDHQHIADGSDHTAYVKIVRMTKIGEIHVSDPGLQFYIASVWLSAMVSE